MNRERQGEILLALEALLWAFFPVITKLSLRDLPSVYALAFATVFSIPVFALTQRWDTLWRELRNRQAVPWVLAATFIIGVLFYLLIFLGASRTSAGNTGILLLLEIPFSFFILCSLGRESFNRIHFCGAVLMTAGAFVALFPGTLKFGSGDLFLIAACAVPPLGNYCTQRARQLVSSSSILLVRSIISGGFLLLVAPAFSPAPSAAAIYGALPWLVVNGALLMGISKILWIEAIHRIPVSKAISLNAICPGITLLIAWLLLDEKPHTFQLVAIVPMIAGTWLLTAGPRRAT